MPIVPWYTTQKYNKGMVTPRVYRNISTIFASVLFFPRFLLWTTWGEGLFGEAEKKLFLYKGEGWFLLYSPEQKV